MDLSLDKLLNLADTLLQSINIPENYKYGTEPIEDRSMISQCTTINTVSPEAFSSESKEFNDNSFWDLILVESNSSSSSSPEIITLDDDTIVIDDDDDESEVIVIDDDDDFVETNPKELKKLKRRGCKLKRRRKLKLRKATVVPVNNCNFTTILNRLNEYYRQAENLKLDLVEYDFKLKGVEYTITNQMRFEEDMNYLIKLIKVANYRHGRIIKKIAEKNPKRQAIEFFIRKYNIKETLDEKDAFYAEIITFDRIVFTQPLFTTELYYTKMADDLKKFNFSLIDPLELSNLSFAIFSPCLPQLLPHTWIQKDKSLLRLCLFILIFRDVSYNSRCRRLKLVSVLWGYLKAQIHSSLVSESAKIEAMVKFKLANKDGTGFDSKYLIKKELLGKIVRNIRCKCKKKRTCKCNVDFFNVD